MAPAFWKELGGCGILQSGGLARRSRLGLPWVLFSLCRWRVRERGWERRQIARRAGQVACGEVVLMALEVCSTFMLCDFVQAEHAQVLRHCLHETPSL